MGEAMNTKPEQQQLTSNWALLEGIGYYRWCTNPSSILVRDLKPKFAENIITKTVSGKTNNKCFHSLALALLPMALMSDF